MADEKIIIDVTAALSDIAKLKGGMVDLQAQASKTGSAITASMNPEAAKGVADAVNDLQNEYRQLKTSADTLKGALKGATDPTAVKLYARSIAELELGMQKLEKTGKAAGVNLKEMNKGAGTGKEVFEGFFGAFTKVTLIIGALSAVKDFVAYAVNLSTQINQAKRSFEAFTGSAESADKIVQSLIATGAKNFIPTDDILSAGKALLAFGENADNLPAILGRIADVSAATGKDFNELTTIYGKARTAGVLYAEDINQLVDAGIPIIQEFAKQMGVSNDQVKKLASEGKISFEELQLAMFNLTAEGGKFEGQAQLQSSTIGGAWKQLVATVTPAISTIGDAFSNVVRSGIEKLNGLLDFAKKAAGVLQGAVVVNPTGANADKASEDADRGAYEKGLDEKLRLEKEAADKRKSVGKKSTAELANLEKQRQQAILNGMVEGTEKEIAQENFRFEALKKELKRFHLDTSGAEEQHKKNLDEIDRNAAQKTLDAIQKQLDIREAIYKKALEAEENANKAKKADTATQVQALKDLKDLKDTEVAIQQEAGASMIRALEASGAKEEQVKEAKRQLDLEGQKQRLQNELDFQLAFLETIDAGNTAQIDATLAAIDKLRAQIKGKGEEQGAGGKGGSKGKAFDLAETLGLDDNQLDALNQAKDQVVGILQELTAAKVAAADEDLKIAEDKVASAEDALKAEQDLAKEGFANDVDLREKELERAKADEEKALVQKKKAQKQQLVIDSIAQGTALVTSAANILSSLTASFGFLGVALAVPIIGLMFGAFASSKAKAFQAAKYKHGGQGKVNDDGVIVGSSHDNGGVGIEAEGGEFFGTDGKRFGIVNKKMTAKHFDLLAAVNRDDKAGMIAAVSKIAMNRDGVGAAIGEGRGSVVVIGSGKADNKDVVEAINKPRKTRTVEGGYVVETEGNFTRRTKIK